MRNASQQQQRVLFILWSRVCVLACCTFGETKQRLVKGEIFYYNVLSMRHSGSRGNPRSHPLVHHYTETKMHTMMQKDSALATGVTCQKKHESPFQKKKQKKTEKSHSLARTCYECVKKIVACATHGGVINMKAPFSRRNKTMT